MPSFAIVPALCADFELQTRRCYKAGRCSRRRRVDIGSAILYEGADARFLQSLDGAPLAAIPGSV